MTILRGDRRKLPARAGHFLGLAGGGQDAEDFFLAHDDQLFAVNLHFGAGILAEEDTVTSFYVEREDLAFVVGLAFTDGDHFTFLRLFFSRVGDDDSATNRFLFLNATDENTVMQGG